MKSRLTFLSFFSLGCLLSLSLYFGCGDTGDTGDTEEATPSTYNMLPDEPDKQWLKLKDEDWEKLKDEDWIRLTDEEIEEFMNLEMPQRWGFETKDRALYQKYRHATLFQRFGDIPQVRYIVEFERLSRGGLLTLELAEQLAARFEAMYFLFPNAVNRRSLEESRTRVKQVEEQKERRFLDQLRIDNPEVWVKYQRAALIDKHGDIPEVDIIINFLRKLELQLPRTDKECRAYLKAYQALYDHTTTASPYEFYARLETVHQIGRLSEPSLRRLEKYREARAEGISFYDIDWEDR